jgi:hypothetical protein
MTVPKTAVLPLHHSPAGVRLALFRWRPAGQGGRDSSGAASAQRHAMGGLFGQSALFGWSASSIRRPPNFGVWLSLVEHRVRDAGVAGSNPATPTNWDKGLDFAPWDAPQNASQLCPLWAPRRGGDLGLLSRKAFNPDFWLSLPSEPA